MPTFLRLADKTRYQPDLFIQHTLNQRDIEFQMARVLLGLLESVLLSVVGLY